MRMLVILVGRLKIMSVSRQSVQTKQSGVSEHDSGAASEDKGSTDD